MKPITLLDETRRIGAPTNWDADRLGECIALSVHDRERDGLAEMVSAWLPDDEEIARLQEGRPLFLCISGTVHPVVSLSVGVEPVADRSRDLARDIAAVVSASVAARIDIARSLHPHCRLLVSPPKVTANGVAVEFLQASPLEVIPPELSDWQVLGPFVEPVTETRS